MSCELGGVYIATVKEAKLDNEGCIDVEIESRQHRCRAHLASPGAGDVRGVFWIPDKGDQVVVAYLGGGPNKAVVLGGLWSTRAKPPFVATDDKNAVKLIKTRSGHSILLSDEANNQKIEIKDSSGKLVFRMDSSNKIIEIDDGNQNRLKIDSQNNAVTLECSGKLKLSGQSIEIVSTGGDIVVDSTAGNHMIQLNSPEAL